MNTKSGPKTFLFRTAAVFLIAMMLFAALPVSTARAATDTFTTPGSNSWIAPAGVTSVTVEVWGGGGKGGSRTANGGGGGGGGGGYSIKASISVTPGNTYTAFVGAGATTTAAGGDSYFISAATAMAKGGNSVADDTATAAAGGLASAGVGDTKYSGGNGAAGVTSSYGGGGGSSAGTAANGASATNATGAIAPTNGGNGGAGSSGQGNGTAGTAPGGGGGGALRTSSQTRTGGAGANGKVVITYTLPPTTTVGTGTAPSSKFVKGLDTNKAVSAFTLATSTGTDTVTGMTVTVSGSGLAAVNAVNIYQDNGTVANEYDAGDTLKGTASYNSGTGAATFSGLSLAVTTSATQYLITVGIVASPTNGQTMLARVTSATATNVVTNNDSTDATLTIDSIAPTISIGTPSAASTKSGPITYTVTYADANFSASTLAVGNISLTATGTASGTIASVTGSGTTRTVTINTTSGNGTLSITIAAGTASDSAGNLALGAGPSATFIVDNTAPTVSTFTATTPSNSLAIPITAFSAADTGGSGVAAYMITTTNIPPAANNTDWVVGTAPTTYTVISDGTYTLYPWAKDAAGNVSSVFATPRTVVVLTTLTISGNVGMTGVTLSYTDGTDKTATSTSGGAYSFTVSNNWSGTVTPSLAGYTFTPESKDFTNVITNQTQNFTPVVIGTPKDYYVNKMNSSCSDSGGGTLAVPFCTLGAGANAAIAGDTVHVQAGSYAETVKPHFGQAGHPISFLASSGVKVTGGTTSAFRLSSGQSYIVIDDFIITGTISEGIYATGSNHITISNNQVSYAGNPNKLATPPSSNCGIYLSGTTNSTVTGNTTDHNSLDGIRLINGSSSNTVSNNVSFANSAVVSRSAEGIDVETNSTNNTIIHNITYANEDSGLNFYTGSSSNLAIGNVSYGNGDHGIDDNASPNNTIIGNTVQGNVTAGINLEGSTAPGSGGATVQNNIVVDNGFLQELGTPSGEPGNIRVDAQSTSGTTIDYNLYYLNTGGTVQVIWNGLQYTTITGFGQEAHGLIADPLFTLAAPAQTRPAGPPWTVALHVGDYHIKAGSAAIDSANSNAPSEPITDIEATARWDDPDVTNTGAGTRLYDDRGAYEFYKTAQTITFTSTAPSGAVVGGATYTATATATSGLPVALTIDATTSSVCSISAGVVSFTAGGTCTIDANQAGNTTYTAAPQVQQSFSVAKADQAILTIVATPSTVVYGSTSALSTTGGSGTGAVTYSVGTSTGCSVAVSTLSVIDASGSCSVTATKAADASYNAATSVALPITLQKAAQATLAVVDPSPVAYGTTPTLSTIGGSGTGAVTFNADGSTGCSATGSTLSVSDPGGTCSVTATKAADTNYNVATSAALLITLQKGTQAILSVVATPSTVVYGSTSTLSATGGSGSGAVSYSVDGSTGCSVTGNTLSVIDASGTCNVTATKAADAFYNIATSAAIPVSLQKATQATLTVMATPSTVVYGSTSTLSTTGGTGTGTVSYSTDASTGCSVTGSTLSVINASGTCNVTATKAADNNYNAVTSAAIPVTLQKAAQAALTVVDPSPVAYGTTPTLTTAGGSGTGAVSYDVGTSTGCSVTGNILSVIDASGTCNVTATKAADTNYNAANSAALPVILQKATQASLTVVATPSTVVYGSTSALSTTGGSGTGAVTYSAGASTGCSVLGSTLSVTNASGTCSVTATRAADASYNAITSAAIPVTLQKADQTLLAMVDPSPVIFATTPTLSTTGGNGTGAVTFNVGASTGCSVTGNTLSVIDVSGTCSVTVTKAADNNYNATTSATIPVTLQKANQTITFNALPNKALSAGDFTVIGTASSNLPVIFTTTTTTVCNVTTGGSVHLITIGTCTIKADQGGNGNYIMAPQVQQSFTVVLSSAVTTLASSGSPSNYGDTVTFTATVSTGATGVVKFYDGTTLIGTIGLNLGSPNEAVLYYNGLDAASSPHSITATYFGDSTFAGSTSPILSQVVNKVPLSVTANNASKSYDGLAYNGGNGVVYAGFVNSESAAVLGGSLAYLGTSQGAINAGSYSIIPSGLTSGNYTITFHNGTLTVNKVALSVTANDASKTYDGLAYSGGNGVVYAGFVNSETSAVLGGTLIYGGTSQGAINANSYTINPSGLTSGNYTITFHAGTLTINKADQTITFGILADKHVNDADFILHASASSVLTVSFTTTTTTICNVTLDGTVHLVGQGICTITAKQSGNGNYNAAADVSQSFNVGAPINHAPVITEGASISVNATVNTQLNLTLHATDQDLDIITWSIDTFAVHGLVSVSGTGPSKVITYTPTQDYAGTDSFIVKVADGHGGTATIIVNVMVTAAPPTHTIYLPIILR